MPQVSAIVVTTDDSSSAPAEHEEQSETFTPFELQYRSMITIGIQLWTVYV